jgi:hypothetical protein
MRHLEAYVQEEIGAQRRTVSLLEAHEQALYTTLPAVIQEATKALEEDLRPVQARARRRDELLRAFGRLWGVEASTLTLGSLIERAGPDAERLQRQRQDLRDATAKVARQARRNAVAARTHQRLTADIIESLLAQGGEPVENGGSLVNAEA